MTVTDQEIGAKIREWRHKRGMGQPELGKVLDITVPMVQKYETGVSSITAKNLMKVAKALRCKTTDLLPKK